MGTGGGNDTEPALRALGRVLGDLTSLGYSAQWRSIRASDIGAPHHRERVFVLAWRNDSYTYSDRRGAGREKPVQSHEISSATPGLGERHHRGSAADTGSYTDPLFPTPTCSDIKGAPLPETYTRRLTARGRTTSGNLAEDIPYLLPTPNTMDSLDWRNGEARLKALKRGKDDRKPTKRTGNLREEVHFGCLEYALAIER